MLTHTVHTESLILQGTFSLQCYYLDLKWEPKYILYMDNRYVSVVPMYMDVMQSVYTSFQIVWKFFVNFLYSCFSSSRSRCICVNSQSISTEANTTQVFHIRKPQRHQGCN